MQVQFARAVRLGAVTIGSIALMGVGANAASAASVRFGTASTNPTSSSTLVASGTSVGATALIGTASFTAPKQGSGPTPTSGSCSAGNLSGVLGTNPATSIAITSAALRLQTCTDNGPTYDLDRVDLASPTTATLASGGSSSGTLSISNPTFSVRVVAAGTIVPCTAVLVTPGTITGVLNNADSSASGQPTLAFTNVVVKANTTTGTCASAIGAANGATTPDRSTLSVKFGPVKGLSGAANGNRLGIFP